MNGFESLTSHNKALIVSALFFLMQFVCHRYVEGQGSRTTAL